MKTKTGIELIAAERARQNSVEGWTPLHDSEHSKGEMAEAAICYTQAAQFVGAGIKVQDIEETPPCWPWDAEWWKPGADRVRNLVKAGALIAAEIDRLNRHEQHAAGIEIKPGRGLADS